MRRLNDGLGMPIVLTTQSREEADELADRLAIISKGRLVAEGTPDELKRSLGSDVIVAEVEGDAEVAAQTVRAVDGIESVTLRGGEITAVTADGASAISPVAVALNHCGVEVRHLTLRTPTLDDVFLELTGGHLEADE